MILQLKSAILQRLQPLSSRVRIISDDTEGEGGTASQIRNDYILRVGYSGGSFTPPDSLENIGYQYCERTFQIAVEIRDLRSEDKAVQLIEDIESLLLGYHICLPGVIGDVSLQSDRFVQNREGIYFYSINFAIPTLLNHE